MPAGEASPSPIIDARPISATATVLDDTAPGPATSDARANLQRTPSETPASLDDTPTETAAVAAVQPMYYKAENLVLDLRTKHTRRQQMKILILCGGPNSRRMSFYNLLISAGFDCVNYDRLNGQQFDLVDDVTKDEILPDIAAGEYVAAFAVRSVARFQSSITYQALHPSERWKGQVDTALHRTTRNKKRR